MNTVDDIIKAMGGATEMARRLGVSVSSVYNWKAADVIPSRWYAQIEYEVEDVPLDLFDFA